MSCTIVTDENFQKEVLEYSNPVAMVFEAEWSGPSHIMAPIIEDLAGVFEGKIKMCRLDVDTYGSLMREYGIRGLPTMLLFKRGQIVDSLTGIVSKPQLKEWLNSFLNPTRRVSS